MATPETTTPTPVEIAATLRDQPGTQRDIQMAAAPLDRGQVDIRATLAIAGGVVRLLEIAGER